jgi:hypothetical protein
MIRDGRSLTLNTSPDETRQLSLTESAVRLRREAGADRHNAALFWTSHQHNSNQLLYIVPTSHHETTVYRPHPISPPSVYSNTASIQLPLSSSRRVQLIDQSPTYKQRISQSAAQLGNTSDIAASSSDNLPGPNSIAADCISKRCDSNCAFKSPSTHTYHRHGRS